MAGEQARVDTLVWASRYAGAIERGKSASRLSDSSLPRFLSVALCCEICSDAVLCSSVELEVRLRQSATRGGHRDMKRQMALPYLIAHACFNCRRSFKRAPRDGSGPKS